MDPDQFEHDSRWTACDEYLSTHLNAPLNPYWDSLERAAANSESKGLPGIAVPASQGKFLSVQCQIVGAKNVLEVGTLGAYSTIWMASSSPEVKVVTIEIDPEHAKVAKENIRAAGLEDRVEIILGAATEILPKIVDEVQSGKRPRFDFSFIDADKENSLNYFNWCKAASRSRGVVYVDNVVRKGAIADAEKAKIDTRVAGVRKAIESVGKDEAVDGVVLQTVGEKSYDGFLMAIVK